MTHARWIAPWLLVLLTALPARGQEDARAHTQRAEAAFALAAYSEAAREYEAAFKLKPISALLYNAAQAHRLAGEKERALQLYVNYLRVYGDRVSNRRDVEAMIEKLKNAQIVEQGAQTAPPTTTVSPTAKPEAMTPASTPGPSVPPSAVEKLPDPAPREPDPPAAPAKTVGPPEAGKAAEADKGPAAATVTSSQRTLFLSVLVASLALLAGGVAIVVGLGTAPRDPIGTLNPFVFGGM